MNYFNKALTTILIGLLSSNIYAKNCDNTQTRENVLTKIGYAPTKSGMQELSKYCHWKDWIKNQLNNSKFYDDSKIEKKFELYETTKLDGLSLMRKYNSQKPLNEQHLIEESFDRRFQYAIYSENRLREMMVWFWFNHFNVYGDSGAFRYMKSYEDIFRNNAFGNFKTILWEVSHHPAMLLYLDNDLNNKEMIFDGEKIGLNDNYAREFLELHTMGVNGGYTEQDIHSLAKILSGFKSIQMYSTFLEKDFSKYKKEFFSLKNKEQLQEFYNKHPEFKVSKVYENYGLYIDYSHDQTDKKFLNKTINNNKDQEIEQVIDILAKEKSTANFISNKLATFFLGNNKTDILIKQMSKKFLETDGDIKEVLTVLLFSKEWEQSLNKRDTFKNPYEYYISTSKLTLNDLEAKKSKNIMDSLYNLGFGTHFKLTPEGYSLNNETYLSPNILHQYINFSQFIESEEAFGIKVDIEKSFFNLKRNDYLNFLTSKKWLYK